MADCDVGAACHPSAHVRSVFTNNFFGCEELAPKPVKYIADDKSLECRKCWVQGICQPGGTHNNQQQICST